MYIQRITATGPVSSGSYDQRPPPPPTNSHTLTMNHITSPYNTEYRRRGNTPENIILFLSGFVTIYCPPPLPLLLLLSLFYFVWFINNELLSVYLFVDDGTKEVKCSSGDGPRY